MSATKVSQNSSQLAPDSHQDDLDEVENTFQERFQQRRKPWWTYVCAYIPMVVKDRFTLFDSRVDGAASFFLKHAGKSRFMIAMSKKAQYLGVERLWYKGPKAFIYFFFFYLLRDTILYIVIPIFFAKVTS